MEKTIATTFDPKSLPRWAQNDPQVVELCKRDLSFRANVCAATKSDYKKVLKQEAARRA